MTERAIAAMLAGTLAIAGAACTMKEPHGPPDLPQEGHIQVGLSRPNAASSDSNGRNALLSITKGSDEGDTAMQDIFFRETSSSPPPPRNLRVEAAGVDSLSLRLSWDPPGQTVDGYIVYFMGNVLDTVDTNYYEDRPASLGPYLVRAYRRPNVSAAVGTTSALHEQTGQGPLYWMQDPDPAHRSGYGWDSAGNGTVYLVASVNRDYIDFVLDASEDLRSPADSFGMSWHSTRIAHDSSWTYAGLTSAPDSGYGPEQRAILNGVYVLNIESGYFLKLEITTYDVSSHSIIFRYGFQRITGFRRVG